MRREQSLSQHVVGQARSRPARARTAASTRPRRRASRAAAARGCRGGPGPRARAAPPAGRGGGSARTPGSPAGRRKSRLRTQGSRCSAAPPSGGSSIASTVSASNWSTAESSTAAASSSGLIVAAASRISWWCSVAESSAQDRRPGRSGEAHRDAPALADPRHLLGLVVGHRPSPAPQHVDHLAPPTTRGPRPSSSRPAPAQHRVPAAGDDQRAAAARARTASSRASRRPSGGPPRRRRPSRHSASASSAASQPVRRSRVRACARRCASRPASHWRSSAVLPDPASAAIDRATAAVGGVREPLDERAATQPRRRRRSVGLAPGHHGTPIIWRSPPGGEAPPPVRARACGA